MAPRRDNGGCSVPPPDDVINKNSTHAVRVAANLGSTSWHRRKQVTKESPERPFSISPVIFRHAQKAAFAELCWCQCAGWRESRTKDESSISGVVVYRTTPPAIGRVAIKSNAPPGGWCSTIGKHVNLTYTLALHTLYSSPPQICKTSRRDSRSSMTLSCTAQNSFFCRSFCLLRPAPRLPAARCSRRAARFYLLRCVTSNLHGP